ncbi:MAG: SsrA-binding protein SmpB [Deltaproteobacteria bacterium]|nr:SsrA-binding protein SmpB [Deltaproteobacteria bacterium]
MSDAEKLITRNRKAFHDYHIVEEFEAGLVLQGTEVKALREGSASIKEGWVDIKDDEAWLVDAHIPPYSHGSDANHEPFRRRKLLLHKREIRKMDQRIKEKGYTAVPLRLYFKRGVAKLVVGLAKGKTHGDKRESMRERDDKRDMDRAMRTRRK